MDRDDILAEVRRTALENGGKPLGVVRFEKLTGIRPYDWGRHWARFGELQREAGYEPNVLVSSFSDDYLLERLVLLTRELKRFPTANEMRLKRTSDSDFPNAKVYERLGNKAQLRSRAYQYCVSRDGYADVAKIIEPHVDMSTLGGTTANTHDSKMNYGFVYLVKGHPGEYKIGRTNLVDRRLSELGATASIEQELVHEIKTDDPAGIESYWHKRFAAQRMRGEWFRLTAADIKTFKRWRHIY
jgi:hypothetical protein